MKKIFAICIIIIVFLGFGACKTNGNQINLTEISQLHTGSRTVDVYVKDDVLYALDLDYGLYIYNISNISAPTSLGTFRDSYTFSHAFCYRKELIFIADYEDKLEIVNVSNPSIPQIIGQYQESDSGVEHFGSTNLHVIGDLVLLASQYEGLEIIDVEDPMNPVKIGSYYDGLSINVVYAIENLVFIREMGGSFKILDISDPTSLIEIYHCMEVNVGQNFFVMDNLLYVPDSDFGIRIFDITDPANTNKIGEKQIDGNCMKCVIEERGTHIYAYISAEEEGLFILDVTYPENIQEIAQYNDGGQSFSLFIQNDLLFVAEFAAGLEILQIDEIEETEVTPSLEAFFVILGLFLMLVVRQRRESRANL
ncbi:MAG: LVIVD repeat-containing protein [Promethearchaeota archaeon]